MNITERDLKHIWHPCSQMKDYETFPPLHVKRAEGVYIELVNNHRIIDAISSWWCKPLGHAHPRLKAALFKQAERFEHVLLANTTNDVIVELSEKLTSLIPSLSKVFYASDGSSAVEIAIKMSLHARRLMNQKNKKRFLSLQNGYHGETIMTLAVSDMGIYKKPYEALCVKTHLVENLPYVSGRTDPLWFDAKSAFDACIKKLTPLADTLSALIVEPIVQGSSGMLIYSQDFLRRLSAWCNQHDIHVIADEIMTGFGRTGKMLACEHAGIEPDFLCLSKGLTAGWLPMSAVLTSNKIYDLFYDDYNTDKAFMHSHTHTGNALCAAVALEAFSIYEEENIAGKALALETLMRAHFETISKITGAITNIRSIGGITACDLLPVKNQPRLGFAIYQEAIKQGALLRPLGNTLYWFPPLTITKNELAQLADMTELAIVKSLYSNSSFGL